MGDEDNLCQGLTLILSDGRRLTYLVPAYVKEDEEIRVVGIEFSSPRPLPAGCRWGEAQ